MCPNLDLGPSVRRSHIVRTLKQLAYTSINVGDTGPGGIRYDSDSCYDSDSFNVIADLVKNSLSIVHYMGKLFQNLLEIYVYPIWG